MQSLRTPILAFRRRRDALSSLYGPGSLQVEVGNAASRKHSSGEAGEAVTQLRYAREGIVTGEMRYVAGRKKMEPETNREEVARGRIIIPASVNHVSLEPMCIGKPGRVKINANIGNSQTTSEIETEIEKLRTSVKYGADTVMDGLLRRGYPEDTPRHHRGQPGAHRYGSDLRGHKPRRSPGGDDRRDSHGRLLQARGFLLHVRPEVLLDAQLPRRGPALPEEGC
jgi:hypothetical protein